MAESLLERDAFDPQDTLHRYLTWWGKGGFDTGLVSARVFDYIRRGAPPQEATALVHRRLDGMTAGCNPAHRSPPLSMAIILPDEHLVKCAIAEASLTHQHSLAGEVAAATVILCRKLIKGVSWNDAISEAAQERHPEVIEALTMSEEQRLSAKGYAPDVLRAAVHFAALDTDFVEALNASLEFAGLTNYSPVLVGAFAGAKMGSSQIPEHLLAHCTILDRVKHVARALALRWR